MKCLIFHNGELGRTWVVLFDTDKNDQNHVTHVLMVTDGREVMAWCRDDVCV